MKKARCSLSSNHTSIIAWKNRIHTNLVGEIFPLHVKLCNSSFRQFFLLLVWMSKWHLDDHAALFNLFVRLPPPPPHGLSWLRICLQYRRAGFNPWVRKIPREGKGYPLQHSVLENSMDCIVHGVAKSQIQLRDFHFPLPHQMQSNSPISKPIKDSSIKIQKCPGANRQVP